MKLLNEYLDYLDKRQLIQESKGGVIGTLNKILVFFGWGAPKDTHVQRLNRTYAKGLSYCAQNFGSKGQVTTTQKAGEEDVSRIVQSIEENPEYGKCVVRIKVQYLKELINYLDKQPKKACSKGYLLKRINPDMCIKWIEKYLPDFKEEVKMAERAVRETDKQKNVSVVINKIKKII